MSFVTPRDRDYLRVKRIKQGQCRVDPVYDAFIEGFRDRYGVSPLAVLLDTVSRQQGQGKTARLGVVLERTDQYRAFVRGSFRPERHMQQAVAILFTESLRSTDLPAMFGFPRRARHAGVRADEIFVYFADFERVAKWEVHNLVAGDELEDFTASLAIGDQFWCIQRFADSPIVFVHTDQQARTLRASALPVTWANTYFEIAKRHDEFGYLIRSEIVIQVDSKENFEANYSGNWYYYFK
ncbi:MAG: hypothetical protein ACTHJW_26030 [Streptosporangiaceae bacterium]